MRIRHDSEKVKEFSTIMLGNFYEKSKSRHGFHRSDAICCPLMTYWQMTGLIEKQYSTKDVGTLLLGTLAHIVLHENFDAQEKIFRLKGIYITVDAIHGKHPIETKTTRKTVYRKEDLPESWIEQLCIAMAVMGVNTGYLMVLSLITFGLTVWEITLSEKERDMFLRSCVCQIIATADAINKKDPDLLTPKYTECVFCAYRPRRGKKGCPYWKKVKKKT